MCKTSCQTRRRRGFTLVEMMVSIAILLLLAAIAVLIVPQMMSRQAATEGASKFQGWLIIAQQRAKRDQAPRGIRLNLSQGTTPQYVTDLQYIEQPDDYYITGTQIVSLTGITVTFAGTGLDFYGGSGAANPTLWQVQPGDYLIVNGGGPPHQITAVGNANTPTATTLTLAPTAVTTAAGMAAIAPGMNVQIPLQNVANIPIGCFVDLDYNTGTAEPVLVTAVDTTANAITVYQVQNPHGAGCAVGTAGVISKTAQLANPQPPILQWALGANPQWTVRRQPRVLAGEDTLQLPQDVAIDLSLSRLGTSVAYNQTNIDILFDRQGLVIGPMTAYDKIMLWVRDVTLPPPPQTTDGDHTLVCIYCRTGSIASHPVNFDPSLGSYYAFALEGRAEGE